MTVALWSFAKMSVFGADMGVDPLAAALVVGSAYLAYGKKFNLVLLILLCAAAWTLFYAVFG
jgi:hypothetical protein